MENKHMKEGLYRNQRTEEQAWKVWERMFKFLPDDVIKEMTIADNPDYDKHLLITLRIPIGDAIPEE